MDLGKEIQQSKFRNEYQKVLVNIIYTHGWITRQLKKFLKQYGITMQQYNVLRILNGQYPNPISTSTIRERMLDRMSDASRIVDRLCKKELVLRKTCDGDRRLVDVVLTEKGRQLVAEIDKHQDYLDSITMGISEEESVMLNNFLDRIRG